MKNLLLALVACAALAGCGARVEGTDPPGPSGKQEKPSSPSNGGGSGSSTAPSPPAASYAAASCDKKLSGRVATPTEAVFREQLIGVFTLCGTTSVFGTSEAGLEIAADGRWYKLASDGAGTLSRLTGFDDEGRWDVIDTSSMNGPGSFQLNLTFDGGGTVITHPQFSETPRGARLNNMGVYIADYVRAD